MKCLANIALILIILITIYSLTLSTLTYEKNNNDTWIIKVKFIFYLDNQPLRNEWISVSTTLGVISGFTNENGLITKTIKMSLKNPNSLYDYRLNSVLIKGKLYLERIYAFAEYYPYNRWVISDYKKLCDQNVTSYRIISRVYFGVSINYSKKFAELHAIFYFTRGKIFYLNVLNPFTGVHKVYIRYYNWIPILGTNYIMLPLKSKYISFMFWLTASVQRAEGEFTKKFYQIYVKYPIVNACRGKVLELTSAISYQIIQILVSEVEETKHTLTYYNLWSQDLENKYKVMKTLAKTTPLMFQKGNYYAGMFQLKQILKNYAYIEKSKGLVNIISNYFVTPVLILILEFFAYSLARILSEKKWRLLAIILFIISLCIFSFMNSYLVLYITSLTKPLFAEPKEMHMFRIFLLTVLFSLFGLSLHPKISQRFSIFELVIRNICARKKRFILVLIIVTLVSLSAITHMKSIVKRVYYKKELSYSPTVNYGITLKKAWLDYIYGTPISARYMSFELDEALWYMSKYNCNIIAFKVDEIQIQNKKIKVLLYFFTKSLPLYKNVTNNYVLISDDLAKKYNITIKDVLRLNNLRLTICDIYKKSQITKIRDIDGELLFSQIPDIIILKTTSHLLEIMKPYISKISIVLSNLNETVEQAYWLASLGVDTYKIFDPSAYGGRGAVRIRGYTYVIHIIHNGKVVELSPTDVEWSLSGYWQYQAILVLIGILMIFVSATGIVFERKREAQILSSLGGSPSDIIAIFALEGTIVGITGGIIAYFLSCIVIYILNSITQQSALTPLGPAEFFILIVIGTLTSILGYIVPTLRASLLVVPSKKYLLKVSELEEVSEVIKRNTNEIVIKLPFKFHVSEKELISHYLTTAFIRLQSERKYGLLIKKIKIKEDTTKLRFIYETDYKSPWKEIPIPMTITILLTKGTLMELYISIKSKARVSLISSNIKEVVSILRECLLYYIEWKRKVK